MNPSYQDFINAAIANDLDSVNNFLSIPAIFNQAATNNDEILYTVIALGKTTIVDRLLQIPAVVATCNSIALCAALTFKQTAIAERLLQIPTVESNAADCDNEALRIAAREGLLTIVNRLLQIPAVEANATACDNEALRMADLYGHQEIVNRLLNIPAVRQAVLAADDSSVDLRELAQNNENSMRALDLHEQGSVNALKARYPEIRNEAQRQATLEHLREFLIAACGKDEVPVLAHPSSVQLQELNAYCLARFHNRSKPKLSEATALLLKQLDSTPHRALRYISDINPFMAPDASFFETLGNGRSAEISKNDWELIALLWDLLNDESAERCDGASLKDCQETFVHTLASLARAHNYDHDQTTDDNLLDKPSCWMGVTRRLIESIPNFTITDNPETRPLDGYYLEKRFKEQRITNDEAGLKPLINALSLNALRDIQQAIQVIIDGDKLKAAQDKLLNRLKLPEEAITSFIIECKNYYGELRFAALRDFRYIDKSYSTTENFIRALASNLRDFYFDEINLFVTQELEANSKEEIEEPIVIDGASSSTYTPNQDRKRKREEKNDEPAAQPSSKRERNNEDDDNTSNQNSSWCCIA